MFTRLKLLKETALFKTSNICEGPTLKQNLQTSHFFSSEGLGAHIFQLNTINKHSSRKTTACLIDVYTSFCHNTAASWTYEGHKVVSFKSSHPQRFRGKVHTTWTLFTQTCPNILTQGQISERPTNVPFQQIQQTPFHVNRWNYTNNQMFSIFWDTKWQKRWMCTPLTE